MADFLRKRDKLGAQRIGKRLDLVDTAVFAGLALGIKTCLLEKFFHAYQTFGNGHLRRAHFIVYK